MRGEYIPNPIGRRVRRELPPHARRILETLKIRVVPRGTTSACAENTGRVSPGANLFRNYLRMRGEYELFWS